MATTLSFRHVSLQINGHSFSGWADEDPPVDFESLDLLEATFGRSGDMYISDRGKRGGEVTVKLLPTSPSAVRCLQWLNESLKDADLDFNGIYADTKLNIGLTMKNGKFKMCDTTVVDGKTFECTWLFEELIPDVDGATLGQGSSAGPVVTA